ncbi:hypothetical protein Tco_0614441 [Tanacetum coccineum]
MGANLSLTDSSQVKTTDFNEFKRRKQRKQIKRVIAVRGCNFCVHRLWNPLCSSSQMQRLQGNALKEKDLKPPRSITEARSILCRDTNNAAGICVGITFQTFIRPLEMGTCIRAGIAYNVYTWEEIMVCKGTTGLSFQVQILLLF